MRPGGRRLRLPVRLGVLTLLLAAAASAAGGATVPAARGQAPCEDIRRTLSNGPAGQDGALTVVVDGAGAFQDAAFNPPGPLGVADTTNSSAVYIGGPAFLEGTVACLEAETPGASLTTRFDATPTLAVELTQTLSPAVARVSTLIQTYRITNRNEVEADFAIVRHVDGDLLFDGSKIDGAAASPDGRELAQFDSADGPPAETALAITGTADGAAPARWTIKPAPYRGQIEDSGGVPAGDHGAVPAGPVDATLSQQWDVENLPPNATVAFTTATRFGTPPTQHTLAVGKTGDGTVTSAPPGILCGTSCSAAYDEGTGVALVAAPDPGWSFAGWSGACSGVAACVVSMDGARSVVAHFNPPPPTPAQNVNAAPVRGRVLVREPGTDRFVELTAADQLPVGTQVDTTNGAIQLTAARAGGITDTSQFFDGLFTIAQAGPAALAELQLNGGDFSCVAGSFSLQAPPKRPVRRLWGSGRGKYRTRGKYSSATVRGTIWKTEDRCDGTLTFVEEGTVGVRDFVRDADVVLRAGQSYLAAPLDRSASQAGCTMIGTPGNDTLRGTPRRDVLCGMGGDDVLLGMGGNDRLYGGVGNDWLDGGAGNDYLNGGGGHDRLDGNKGRDYLWGGAGRDLLITRDKIRGNDRVQGGSGTDRCRTDFVRVCP